MLLTTTCSHESHASQEEEFVAFFCGQTKDIIEMSVSGERMSAKRSTLMKIEDSALARKFDDTVWKQPQRGGDDGDSEDDFEPIDFSAYCFGKMVDHLRLLAITGRDATSVACPVIRADERGNFERLVKYFFPGREDPFIASVDSAIFSAGHTQLASPLLGWLTEVTAGYQPRLELLYRASRDGWAANQFHSMCDNRGPTITLIRCTAGHIFGGYSDQPWTTAGQYLRSDHAFLFSLRNPAGIAPTKMPLTGSSNGNAIFHHGSYGPTFGDGHDLQVPTNSNVSNGCTSLGNSYRVPPGQNSSFLVGNSTFLAAEIEVFSVN